MLEERWSLKEAMKPMKVPLALVLSRMETAPTASMLKPSALSSLIRPSAPL